MEITIQDLKPQWSRAIFDWRVKLLPVTKHLDNYYFVGGIVRDSLLGKYTNDIDITTTMLPEEIIQRLRGYSMSLIGQRFGTIGIFFQEWKIEITTTRKDINSDGRHADVLLGCSFYEDSQRRDFTINALLLREETIIDYHGGLQDLLNGQVKFIGNPEERIREDYLRILRYFRFSLRFSKNYNTYDHIIVQNMGGLSQLSMERIITEFTLMCQYEGINDIIQHINHLGISRQIFGTNLPFDVNYQWSIERKMAHLFADIEISLPLGKKIERIKQLYKLKYRDVYLSAAYVWRRYQDVDLLKEFANIYQLKLPEQLRTPTLDFSAIPIKQRSEYEIIARYLILLEKEINQSELFNYHAKFFS